MDDQLKSEETQRSSVQRLVDEKKKQIQSDVKVMLRDDLIGVSDWKSSKFGTLTGFSAASRAMKGLGDNLSNSTQNLGNLLERMTAREVLPSLPEDVITAPDEIRFEASRVQHDLTDAKIAVGLRNTFWSVYLFGFSFVVYLLAMAYWDIVEPPKDIVMFIVRFGFSPFLLALCFRHAYTNWILRHRLLPRTPLRFIRSLDYLPKK